MREESRSNLIAAFRPAMRALVVEDDAASRLVASRLLDAEGYEVDAVADAAAARARVAANEYALVVLDFVLPDADGLQLLREWRSQGRGFPVLALTGADSDAVTIAFLRAGAHDVIEKTRFDRQTLRAALDGLAFPSAFPHAPEPARAPPEEMPADDVVPPPGRALVVDDVAVARRQAAMLLERDGWRVDEAATAQQGLRLAVQERYDVILLDQLLPDVEGIGLIQELRRRGVDAPVIALTGHGDEALATEFLQAGAVDFIPKHLLDARRLRAALALAAVLAPIADE